MTAMKKAEVEEAGQRDVAARSMGDGQLAGHRWASTFSLSRDAGTAISRCANWLPRDARALILLNAKSPEIVEAQLPLVMFAGSHHEEVAGSLPLTMKPSAGPYNTSRSWAMESHESLTGLLNLHRVAILRASLALRALGMRVTPPPTPSRGRGTFAWPSSFITIVTGGHH